MKTFDRVLAAVLLGLGLVLTSSTSSEAAHPDVPFRFGLFIRRTTGDVPWMFVEPAGNVAAGAGRVFSTGDEAAEFTWTDFQSGREATDDEIRAEFSAVQSRAATLKGKGPQATFNSATIFLEEESLRIIYEDTFNSIESGVKAHFPDYENWPADAQMGVMAMAWSMGPNFPPKFPKFSKACLALDFDAAAELSKMTETNNPGIIPINRANKVFFTNAAIVIVLAELAGEPGLGFERVQYPRVLKPGVPPTEFPLLRKGPGINKVVGVLDLLLEEHEGRNSHDFGTNRFSDALEARVKAFQGANGLSPDGIVGQKTWEKLIVVRRNNEDGGPAGPAVRAIKTQLLLVNLKFDPEPFEAEPFETFDDATEEEVKSFQQRFNLEMDGAVGPDTWKALVAP